MKSATATLQDSIVAYEVRVDDIEDELETARECINDATRAHNQLVGELERERATLRQEACKMQDAIDRWTAPATSTQNGSN